MDNVNYASGLTPPEYKCSLCGKTGVKLWRPYQTMCPDLFCAECAAKDQGKDISTMDAKGLRHDGRVPTDTIGWLVPAVPDEEGTGYWGYTSVPAEGVEWWQALSK